MSFRNELCLEVDKMYQRSACVTLTHLALPSNLWIVREAASV